MRNMSGSGVFVATGECPPEGTHIKFSVVVETASGDCRLFIRGAAQVVRQERRDAGGRAGFAATIKSFTLRHEERKLDEF
jgi:hypothetical protein